VEHGAAIECVVPGSPADEAGLRAGARQVTADGITFLADGDIVVAINEDEVATSEDLGRIVATSLRPGDTASFTVVRGAERVALAVVLGERPGEAGGGC
jgi:S1-C subfamily serine protease